MIVFCSLMWQPNGLSRMFSRMYTEEWAVKLFNGFDRHYSGEHRNILYTDKRRDLPESINQIVVPKLGANGYADCIRPYELGVPMILVGLDTIVVGNIDKLVDWSLNQKLPCYPRDPYFPSRAINGVGLIPEGMQHIHLSHNKYVNDMEHIRRFPSKFIDDEFPGQVRSYKGWVERNGLTSGTRIVYFHGERKPHQLPDVQWIKEHWV